MSVPEKLPELLFRLLIPLGGLFVITILALVMLPFSSTESPVARFLDASGGRLIVGEIALLAVVGLLALATDRLRTLGNRAQTAEAVTQGTAEKAENQHGGDDGSGAGASTGSSTDHPH